MRDYVVQSGPLRTFDALFDPRFEKLRAVGDYHTIQITAKPSTQRRVIAALNRSVEREITFVSSLFAALAGGARTIFGLRDITAQKAAGLAKKLYAHKQVAWHRLNYGVTEDDLTLVELKNFGSDFELLGGCVPPSEGSMFFYLTAAVFDVFHIYWERACNASLKAKDDRFKRDVLSLAHEAKITLWQDGDGSFTVVLHPKVADVETVESEIQKAGERAGMSIVFAPGLFS